MGGREDGRVLVALRVVGHVGYAQGMGLVVCHVIVRGRRRLCCWRVGGSCVWGRHEGPRVCSVLAPLYTSCPSAARSFACGWKRLLCSCHGPARLHELVVSMCVCICVYTIHTHLHELVVIRLGHALILKHAVGRRMRTVAFAFGACLGFRVQGLGFRV